MIVDTLLITIVGQLPNLAVAVWCIYNYQQTIKGLLDQQNKLLDQMLAAKGLKSEITQVSPVPAPENSQVKG